MKFGGHKNNTNRRQLCYKFTLLFKFVCVKMHSSPATLQHCMKIQNGLGVKVVIGFTILHKLYVGGSNVSKSLHNVHVEVFDSHASRPMNRERVVPVCNLHFHTETSSNKWNLSAT